MKDIPVVRPARPRANRLPADSPRGPRALGMDGSRQGIHVDSLQSSGRSTMHKGCNYYKRFPVFVGKYFFAVGLSRNDRPFARRADPSSSSRRVRLRFRGLAPVLGMGASSAVPT